MGTDKTFFFSALLAVPVVVLRGVVVIRLVVVVAVVGAVVVVVVEVEVVVVLAVEIVVLLLVEVVVVLPLDVVLLGSSARLNRMTNTNTRNNGINTHNILKSFDDTVGPPIYVDGDSNEQIT